MVGGKKDYCFNFYRFNFLNLSNLKIVDKVKDEIIDEMKNEIRD